jgi:hypothetical protein
MVVKMMVKNRRRDLPLCRSLVLVAPVAERDVVSKGHPASPLVERSSPTGTAAGEPPRD